MISEIPHLFWVLLGALGALVMVIAATALILAVRVARRDPEVAPDRPRPFPPTTAWIVLSSDDAQAVISALSLDHVQTVNWHTGFTTLRDPELGEHYVFVSPAIDGTVLVVGTALPCPVSARFVDRCTPMLERLAERFEDVRYFVSYPELGIYGWARYQDGAVQRAFAWGDEGIIWNEGAVTAAERDLNLSVFEAARSDQSLGAGGVSVAQDNIGYPDEDDVLRMTTAWGLDIARLAHADGWRTAPTPAPAPTGEGGPRRRFWSRLPKGYGVIGVVPSNWRTQPTQARRARGASEGVARDGKTEPVPSPRTDASQDAQRTQPSLMSVEASELATGAAALSSAGGAETDARGADLPPQSPSAQEAGPLPMANNVHPFPASRVRTAGTPHTEATAPGGDGAEITGEAEQSLGTSADKPERGSARPSLLRLRTVPANEDTPTGATDDAGAQRKGRSVGPPKA